MSKTIAGPLYLRQPLSMSGQSLQFFIRKNFSDQGWEGLFDNAFTVTHETTAL